jgi:hypothetical protein
MQVAPSKSGFSGASSADAAIQFFSVEMSWSEMSWSEMSWSYILQTRESKKVTFLHAPKRATSIILLCAPSVLKIMLFLGCFWSLLCGVYSCEVKETPREKKTSLSPALQKAFDQAAKVTPCDQARQIFEKAFRTTFLASQFDQKVPCDFEKLRPALQEYEKAIALCPRGYWGHVARENRCETLAHYSFYALTGQEQHRQILRVEQICQVAVDLDPERVIL